MWCEPTDGGECLSQAPSGNFPSPGGRSDPCQRGLSLWGEVSGAPRKQGGLSGDSWCLWGRMGVLIVRTTARPCRVTSSDSCSGFCLFACLFFSSLLQHQTPQVTVAPNSGAPRYDWDIFSARPQAGHWELGTRKYASHSPCPLGVQPRLAHVGGGAASTPRLSTPTLQRCSALGCCRSPLVGLPDPSLPPTASSPNRAQSCPYKQRIRPRDSPAQNTPLTLVENLP